MPEENKVSVGGQALMEGIMIGSMQMDSSAVMPVQIMKLPQILLSI